MKFIIFLLSLLLSRNIAFAQKFYVPYEHNGKYGLTDDAFKTIITPAIYDKIEPIADSLFAVTIQKKSGIINNYGKVIIPIRYSSFSTSNYIGTPKLYRNFLIIAYLNKKEIYYDFYGNHRPEIKKVLFSLYGKPSFVYCGDPDIYSPIIFKTNKKRFGLKKRSSIYSSAEKFDTLIAPIFDTLYLLNNKLYYFPQKDSNVFRSLYVAKTKDSTGILDTSGNTILKFGDYDSINRIDNQIIEFRNRFSKLWGTLFVNDLDCFIIQPSFAIIISKYGYYEKYTNDRELWMLYYKSAANIFLVKDKIGKTIYKNLQTGLEYQN